MVASYLLSGEYATYGLGASTTDVNVAAASRLIDAYLRRPKGLMYEVDALARPCFMTAASPDRSFTLQAAVSPGSNVTLALSPPLVTPDMVGNALVIDASNTGARETVSVTGTNGNAQVVVKAVAFAHSSSASVDEGRLIIESRAMPAKRSVARLSQQPVPVVASCVGRYGYGRRSDQVAGLYQEMSLLSVVATFGGPPQWNYVDTTQISIDPITGEVWIPAGQLLAYYSEVRLFYIAGWPQANIPAPIKTATAAVVTAMANATDIPTWVSRVKAGDTEIDRFMASNLDLDIKLMLAEFKARTLY